MSNLAFPVAGICDHTFLWPVEAYRKKTASGESAVQMRKQAFLRFIEEAGHLRDQPYALCVRPEDCPHVPSKYTIASVVGFPDGSWCNTELKCTEAEYALAHGAQEIDMVIDDEAVEAGDWDRVRIDIAAVTGSTHARKGMIKVILESAQRTEEDLRTLCRICDELGVDFVKTSTGFGAGGATASAVRLMAESFPRGIKISGGVTLENVESLIQAAERPIDPLHLRIGASSLLQKLNQGHTR